MGILFTVSAIRETLSNNEECVYYVLQPVQDPDTPSWGGQTKLVLEVFKTEVDPLAGVVEGQEVELELTPGSVPEPEVNSEDVSTNQE